LDFSLSPGPYVEGGSIVVTGKVKNTGTSEAENIKVVAYQDLGEDSPLLELNYSLAAGGSASFQFPWSPRRGTHSLYVVADPENTTSELIESNNDVSFVVNVDGDTDRDGLPDKVDQDVDGDGLPNAWESTHGLNSTNSTDAFLDPDSDGLSSTSEFTLSLDPQENDTDGDGLPDGWEITNLLDAKRPSDAEADTDNDGLSSLEEWALGTDPQVADTDSDGYSDGVENLQGSNPRSPSSVPKPTLPPQPPPAFWERGYVLFVMGFIGGLVGVGLPMTVLWGRKQNHRGASNPPPPAARPPPPPPPPPPKR